MTDHVHGKFELADRERTVIPEPRTPAALRPGAGRSAGPEPGHYRDYDFGALQVRAPAHASVRMADPDAPYCDAVFFVFPEGTVRLSVMAAPRGDRLWPGRAEEIASAQVGLGDQVRSCSGEWGRELLITDATTTNRVIGIDGARWMLLGRSTCPLEADTDLTDTMRAMMRGSVVVRGGEPLPARTPLPLTRPGGTGMHDDIPKRATRYTGTVTLLSPKAHPARHARRPADGGTP